jgi:hypothetical protein
MVAPSLKERYTTIYFPSEEDKKRWEELAKEARVPLSKFIYEMAEKSLDDGKEAPRSELVRELSETKEEAQKLRSDLKIKNMLLEKLEGEVYKTRYASFSDVDSDSGKRRYDEDLIAILKGRNRAIDGYALIKELGVDPRDSEAVKLVSNQLESLRRFGLVEETGDGWRWKR